MSEIKVVVLISLALISVISFVNGFLEFVPERAGVEYINEKYVQYARFYVRKTGRGGIYVVNFDFDTNDTFANNVTVHIVSYELLHNEYRPSFVELHPKLCNLIEKSIIVAIVVRNAGVHCPLVPHQYRLRNLTLAIPEIENMKWVFPFEKTKFKFTFQITATNEIIQVVYLMVTVRQTERKTRH